jgi:hypothetical protein
MVREERPFAAPENSSRPSSKDKASGRKGTTPKKDTSESSLKLPPEMVDVTSQHLGKIFAIVGISPSKPKE